MKNTNIVPENNELPTVNIRVGERVKYLNHDYEITNINVATCELISLEATEERVEVLTSELLPSSQSIEKRMSNYSNVILPNLVAKKLKFALISGQSGLGKSFEMLKFANDTNVVVVKTKITPMQLYILLHDNRESLIVFDDLPQETFVSKSVQSELIKASTDTNEPRKLAWRSSSKLMENYEPEFIFTGSILILTNLPLSFFDSATRNRALCRSLHFSTIEKLQLLKKHLLPMAANSGISEKNAKALFNELCKNLEYVKNDLSLRTLTKLFIEFNSSGDVSEAVENLKY